MPSFHIDSDNLTVTIWDQLLVEGGFYPSLVGAGDQIEVVVKL